MLSIPTLSELEARTRSLTRLAVESGALFALSPRGLLAGARARLAGPLSLPTLFRVYGAGRPDDVALAFEGKRFTWSEMDERIDRLASGLESLGLGPGCSGILLMHNRPEMIEAQVALARLGGSAVSASWRSTPDELEYLVSHSGARAIFVEASVAHALEQARPRLGLPPANIIAVGGEREGMTPYASLLAKGPRRRIDGQEGAVVIYTSGTTGKPKGAVRRFPAEAAWAVIHVLAELGARVDDRHLAVCPMYHSTAFGFIAFTLSLGGTVVIEPSFDPERFLLAIERESITTTAVVPTMLHRVLALPERVRRRYDTRSLRAVFSGGAPLSGELARRTIEELGYVLYNFYGATETGLNTIATPEELLASPGTIGHAIPGNEIRLLDDDGRPVEDGRTGELFVKNAMLVEGYHRDESSTRASMRDGFFSVGDLAHKDARGLFHIDGRKRDMIITGGVNVYPAEIEEVLHRHPAVSECAVVGVPDSEWGERVRAVIVAREPVEADELVRYAREHLAGPKVPREVVFTGELPKNPTGKVLKRELRS